jgi:hypothetical protein
MKNIVRRRVPPVIWYFGLDRRLWFLEKHSEISMGKLAHGKDQGNDGI